MGREQDFLVGDFVLVRIVFLFLIVFREQLLAALVGGLFSFLMGYQFDKPKLVYFFINEFSVPKL